MALACKPDPDIAGLGIGLLRPVQNAPGVREALQSLWIAPPTYAHAWWTMFRLLDYEDLPSLTHKEIFDFTASSWTSWGALVTHHFGDYHEGFDRLIQRVRSPAWKPGKTWVRIFEAACYGVREDSCKLVEVCQLQHGDAILVSESIQWLKTRLSW
jgi:hypothetical protein